MKNNPIHIEINRKRLFLAVLICCIAFEIFLVLLDAYINYGKYTDIGAIRRFCNIAREDSLASWFGTTQTFMVGLTLWLIFLVVRHTSAPRKIIFGWCVLAMFFTYMAVDDGAELHERMGTGFEKIVEEAEYSDEADSKLSGILDIFPSYPWQLLFLPFFSIMGMFMLFFLWNELEHKMGRALIIMGISCFVIAVGLDFIEGLDKNHSWNVHIWIRKTYQLDKYTVRHFSKSLEEFIEMLGTTLLWLAFINYLTRLMHSKICFSLAGSQQESKS